MGVLSGLFGRRQAEVALPLYNAVVLRARAEHWYLAGAVPDTVDGRFDMIAAVLSVVLIRLEGDAEGAPVAARLTEHFIDDMDGQLRELGVGDVVVGKHIGKMMGMLGGRLGAYRDTIDGRHDGSAAAGFDAALVRNLYRGDAPGDAALAHVRDTLLALHAALATTPVASLVQGHLPEGPQA
ncbi:ubiquinol-cytochrome C chaperone [Sphingomonas sp. Leaf17]|uniref:ubiquinol-cytochrome C chaperone family protein n=1 Tax=Sphingomonas sp. Leaf17 TaxID=1735683 RepID=UPI0006FB6594|nr:ubiquinol-cytochrome C chaperone [Sphingomonas sp. Leaf17]